jgi:hypothetical protein
VAHAPHLREKARQLRQEKHLTLDELTECLALPKTTVYYWIRDIPLGKPRHYSPALRKGSRRMQDMYRLRREAAYQQGEREYAELAQNLSFRDFVALYIAEGYKRSRNSVDICNSDAAVMVVGHRWIKEFSSRPLDITVHFHADQSLDELRSYWGAALDVEPSSIRGYKKSNSNKLAGRRWKCVHGVASVRSHDTLFRARLQAWMDLTRAGWLTLDP